jgi:predicted RNase H-like HicB family nuclease
MSELIFIVEEEADGGYVASALGVSIVTQGDSLEALEANVREAVSCHFEDATDGPKMIRLHFVRDKVLAL